MDLSGNEQSRRTLGSYANPTTASYGSSICILVDEIVIINNGSKDLVLLNVSLTLSQLRTTNQQVHWVVQVLPYVSKGRSHRDCWYEASYGHLVNFSQADSSIIGLLV